MMIPERFAMAMIDDGWTLRNSIIWYKRNGMPSSVKDRFSNKWEYVFFFTKSRKYYFDLDSIRKPLEESSIKRVSQKNIPNQLKLGKSVDFAETDPVNNIPKILNNMHKKYNGANTGMNNKEPYKQNNPHLMRLNANKEFFNEKGQGGHVDYNGIDSEYGNHYNENGANPGDVLFDDTIYDLYTDPSIQDAFIDYLESERPELLMPTLLDIPTMSHSFAHFAVFPNSLVDPLIKAGCPSEVCVKCGKPKERIVETNNPSKEFIDKSEEYYQSSGQSSKSLHRNKKDGMNGVYYTGKTIGWMPTCKCNAGFEPGTVLDPFAGSGTVGVVAKEQGKNAILIEVSPEYVEIIKNRLEIKGSGTEINAGFVDVASIESMEEDE